MRAVRTKRAGRFLAIAAASALVVGACGSDDADEASDTTAAGAEDTTAPADDGASAGGDVGV